MASSDFPDEVLEHVLRFITEPRDRNSVSLVCKGWYKAEAWSRFVVFIGNCYSVSPEIVCRRFPRMKSLTLKGKPRFADFNMFPVDWGAFFQPWTSFIVDSYSWFQKLHLKRMNISDQSLLTIAQSLPTFKALVLINCDGFSTEGIAAITSHCRCLEELDLHECIVDERGNDWLGCFSESCDSLVTLNFSCLDQSEINFPALERLVARCHSLRKLRLNNRVNLGQLQRLLVRAPQLVDLGTGSYSQIKNWSQFSELRSALAKCRNIRLLSGFWMLEPPFISLIFPLGQNLINLNLSYAVIRPNEFRKLIVQCPRLECLWVLDSVEDKGLQAVGASCSQLRELRVFPVDPSSAGVVTEAGLVAISHGCPSLSSVLYFCRQCTNEAIETVATNCPMLTSFRLCIITPRQRDYITGDPMDEAFGSIVRNCKNLHRLAVSGLLTDRAFEYIGAYGKKLETLSVAFAGETDLGMQHVLSGCPRLRKLEIRDCPFGNTALLSGLHRFEAMRFLWMSGCSVSVSGCTWMAAQLPRLNVEVIQQDDRQLGDGFQLVDKLYAYRTLVGARIDSPPGVLTLS